MPLLTLVLSLGILAAALWLLVAHRRNVGVAHGVGAMVGVAAETPAENAALDECLCRQCGAAALASVAVGKSSGRSSAIAEATLRRKRMWMAQRGEDFLRKVMFGRRSAGLGPLPGARCRQCHARLTLADQHPVALARKLKTGDGNAMLPATPQEELQFALDLADAMVEDEQNKASLQRHSGGR
jgi:hypothetical protein